MATSLAQRLRSLRGSLTQKELADVLGVSPAALSGWERGHAVPPAHRLEAYAAHFQPRTSVALLSELMFMRAAEIEHVVHRRAAADQTSVIGLLQDIRWLLAEIRERLPPPAHQVTPTSNGTAPRASGSSPQPTTDLP